MNKYGKLTGQHATETEAYITSCHVRCNSRISAHFAVENLSLLIDIRDLSRGHGDSGNTLTSHL